MYQNIMKLTFHYAPGCVPRSLPTSSVSVARFLDLSTICGFLNCLWMDLKAKSRVLWIFLLIAGFVHIIFLNSVPLSS